MKKRITAILAAAIIAVGASVPAFADSDFNTAGNDAPVLLTAQEAQADTALDTLDAISDDSAAVVLSDNYDRPTRTDNVTRQQILKNTICRAAASRKSSVRLYGIFLSEMPNNCLYGWLNFALQALDKRRG